MADGVVYSYKTINLLGEVKSRSEKLKVSVEYVGQILFTKEKLNLMIN